MPAVDRPTSGQRAISPVGISTRGTTAPNRLRRVDRWIVSAYGDVLRRAVDPLVVDLGFGASPVTTTEWAGRLRAVRPDVEVVGIEIDRARVAAAAGFGGSGVSFRHGGFEVPTGDRKPVLIRAFNVLRQYDEAQVPAAWARMAARLAEGGAVVDGTSDELGRLACWVAIGSEGPRTFTVAAHLATLVRPSDLSARLPKALIHRNVPGQPVHRFFADLDRSWDRAAAHAVFGPRQRWTATLATLRAEGHPLVDGPVRWRLGEVTVPWDSVAPLDGPSARSKGAIVRAW